MSSHAHLVFRISADYKPEEILGDFKRFTNRKIIQAMNENPKESSEEWLIEQFHPKLCISIIDKPSLIFVKSNSLTNKYLLYRGLAN